MEGREAAMEGRAAAVCGAAAGVLGDGRERRLGRFAARAAGLAATEVIPGSAAPSIRARHCHAMDHGAALPRRDRWRDRALPRQRPAFLVAATSALCRATMHGAAQAFGYARAIGAAKSVSLKKPRVLDLKLSSKKC